MSAFRSDIPAGKIIGRPESGTLPRISMPQRVPCAGEMLSIWEVFLGLNETLDERVMALTDAVKDDPRYRERLSYRWWWDCAPLEGERPDVSVLRQKCQEVARFRDKIVGNVTALDIDRTDPVSELISLRFWAIEATSYGDRTIEQAAGCDQVKAARLRELEALDPSEGKLVLPAFLNGMYSGSDGPDFGIDP